MPSPTSEEEENYEDELESPVSGEEEENYEEKPVQQHIEVSTFYLSPMKHSNEEGGRDQVIGLLGFGANTEGQLGIWNTRDAVTPTVVPFFSGKSIKLVAAGWNHSIFVTAQDEVFACGSNEFQQLGLAGSAQSMEQQKFFSLPKQLPFFVTNKHLVVKDVIAGRTFTLFLTKDYQIYGCGSNESRVLLDVKGSGLHNAPTKCFHNSFENLQLADHLKFWAAGCHFAVMVLQNPHEIDKRFWTSFHSYEKESITMGNDAIIQVGRVKSYGPERELNYVKAVEGKVTQLRTVASHTVFVTERNEVFAFGISLNETIDDDAEFEGIYLEEFQQVKVQFISASLNNCFVVDTDSNCFITGPKTMSYLVRYRMQLDGSRSILDSVNYVSIEDILEDEQITGLHCGLDFVIAVTNKNRIFSMGNNSKAQLGNGGKNDTTSFQKIAEFSRKSKVEVFTGGYHTFILVSTRELLFYSFHAHCKHFSDIKIVAV